jgi:hypothetical protein
MTSTNTATSWYYVGWLSIRQLFFADGTPGEWAISNGGPGAHSFTTQLFPSAEAAAEYALRFEDGRKPTPKGWAGPRWESR